MRYSVPGVLLPSLPSSFLSYIPRLLFLNKAAVLRNEVLHLIVLPPIRTNPKKQEKKCRENKLHLFSMIILNWTTQMVIIWVWKLGCKMSIFRNVKYKCPFAGKHGTEWIPTVLCPRFFIPCKLNINENLSLREICQCQDTLGWEDKMLGSWVLCRLWLRNRYQDLGFKV